jgi:hypothetical protein
MMVISIMRQILQLFVSKDFVTVPVKRPVHLEQLCEFFIFPHPGVVHDGNSMPAASSTSTLLLEESYASAAARFAEWLRGLHDPAALAALTQRWSADQRPRAQEQPLSPLSRSRP